MDTNRFELQENDFEVIEAPCAKCVYNSGVLFGCKKYERIPATIRIGEEKCDFRMTKIETVNKHIEIIQSQICENKSFYISYPTLTVIEEKKCYLYLILQDDGTVFGKVAIDDKDEVCRYMEFSEKRMIANFDEKEYSHIFSEGIDIYSAMIEVFKSDEYQDSDEEANEFKKSMLDMIINDMKDILHVLKKINPVFFERLA